MKTPHYLGIATLTTSNEPTDCLSGFASLLLSPEGGHLGVLLPNYEQDDQVEACLLISATRTHRLGQLEIGEDYSGRLLLDPNPRLLASLTERAQLRLLAGESTVAEGDLIAIACATPTEGHARLRPAGSASRSASGTVVVRAHDASLTLDLRGLPLPALLGRTEHHATPYETYQVWVGLSKSGRKEFLGELTEREGSRWWFHRAGVPIALTSDVIMVVPASRFGIRKTGPPLLVGSLPSLQPADSV